MEKISDKLSKEIMILTELIKIELDKQSPRIDLLEKIFLLRDKSVKLFSDVKYFGNSWGYN